MRVVSIAQEREIPGESQDTTPVVPPPREPGACSASDFRSPVYKKRVPAGKPARQRTTEHHSFQGISADVWERNASIQDERPLSSELYNVKLSFDKRLLTDLGTSVNKRCRRRPGEATNPSLSPSTSFILKDSNHFSYFFAFGGISPPASFNRLPHTIRDFRVIKASRPMSAHHRVNPRHDDMAGKRRSSRENLTTHTVLLSSFLSEGTCWILTSQARTAKA